ncbi:MAG: DUF5320 domain-containing protein [Thermotogae bacterium]|nr:DUF5320 domain-containing protein [Thermotogota bacterium]
MPNRDGTGPDGNVRTGRRICRKTEFNDERTELHRMRRCGRNKTGRQNLCRNSVILEERKIYLENELKKINEEIIKNNS